MMDAQSEPSYRSDRAPAWYRWYLALAFTNVATFGLALLLGYVQSQRFESAVAVHRNYSEVLERLADVRAQISVVNAPGNDVFMNNDAVAGRQALDDALREFRIRYTALKSAINRLMDDRTGMMLSSYFPKIEQELNFVASDARQVFYFISVHNMREAGAHMASMDEHTSLLGSAFLELEHVLRSEQLNILDAQQTQALRLRSDGLIIAVLVALVAVAAAWHGRRVHIAIREENLERERYQQSLRDARELAEQGARTKSQFLANMSHEIRTPMNGVLGMLEALSATRLSSEQGNMLRTANASADILLAIIDDILDFSKIEAGMLVIEEMQVDIDAVVQRVISLYNVRAHEKMLTLDYQIDPRLPNKVVSDPTRLIQLLSNFVSNAIKFTARGKISIKVQALDVIADKVTVRFSVTDTGMGIPVEAQQKLFTAFTQADNSTSRRFGGTGLGLAICKQLVELLDREHGEIGVRSEPGQGSEFYFELRLPVRSDVISAEPTAQVKDVPVPTAFTGKVLVAEDNDTNQQVILTMLRIVGIEPTLASDGAQAVAAAAREQFDLILMDYHMPVLDGCEASEQIRQFERQQGLKRTPIVALTASVLTEDRERCISAGMDDVLAKPMRQAMLCSVLTQWLTPRNDATSVTHAESILGESSENKLPQSAATEMAFAQNESSHLPATLFDVAQITEMREVTGGGFAGLVRQFHGNVAQGVNAMRIAIESNNADELRRQAHKLKGSAATIGVKEVAQHSQTIEALAKTGTVEGASVLLDRVVQSYLQSKSLLDEFAHGAPEAAQSSA